MEPLGSEWSSEAVLWFQTQVYGEQLSARVLSVTEQGYGVELESRGVNVAAALISEQLAKVPGEIARETHGTTGSATKQSVKTNEQDPLETQVSSQTEVNFKEIQAEGWTAVSTEGQPKRGSPQDAGGDLGGLFIMLHSGFSAIFSSGVEDCGAAAQ